MGSDTNSAVQTVGKDNLGERQGRRIFVTIQQSNFLNGRLYSNGRQRLVFFKGAAGLGNTKESDDNQKRRRSFHGLAWDAELQMA